jgi:preprotein translocase subunit SecG
METPRVVGRSLVDRTYTLAYVPGLSRITGFRGSMLFTFLLVVQVVVTLALITVILMQRSEGGGLTSSGSPAGLMSARGAADFLTRSTAVLATGFVLLSIALSFMAATRHATKIDSSLNRVAPINAPQGGTAPAGGAFGGAAANAAAGTGNLTFPGALAPADNIAAPPSNGTAPKR